MRASIDSLRALTVGGDSLQTMRLDSITRLIADKERRTVSLRRSIRAGATAGLLDKNIRSLIGPREAVVADTIPFRSIVRRTRRPCRAPNAAFSSGWAICSVPRRPIRAS